MHQCPVCDRLAIDYQQTLAEHADFVLELAAAVKAHEYSKIWELRMAVQGSETFCRMAREQLESHRAMHSASKAS